MELVCEKYKERLAADDAGCRHPAEYCKFRSACLIHFLGKEKGREGAGDEAGPQGKPAKDESDDDHPAF